MNKLISKNFIAERQLNGDVQIRAGYWEQAKIVIPKEDCTELAKLLMWPVTQESHKVDYDPES